MDDKDLDAEKLVADAADVSPVIAANIQTQFWALSAIVSIAS